MVRNRKKEKRRTRDRFRFCEWAGGRVELTNERPARVAIITLCQIGKWAGGEWARSAGVCTMGPLLGRYVRCTGLL